jgi:hypothetical protein
MKTNVHFWSYLAQFFLEWKMFQTSIVEKIKTRILCLIFFFKSRCLWDSVEKYCRTGPAADDDKAHAHCMLDAKGCKHTVGIWNAFPLQQLLHERAWTLPYTYFACPVISRLLALHVPPINPPGAERSNIAWWRIPVIVLIMWHI